MRYGLPNHTILAIQGVLKRHPQVEKAILYGSRAKGNFRRGSDIDLALVGEDLHIVMLHQIEEELDELLLPYRIDLSLLPHVDNPESLEHIREAGKVFYERAE